MRDKRMTVSALVVVVLVVIGVSVLGSWCIFIDDGKDGEARG